MGGSSSWNLEIDRQDRDRERARVPAGAEILEGLGALQWETGQENKYPISLYFCPLIF